MNNRIIPSIMQFVFASGFIAVAWMINEPFYWKATSLLLLFGLVAEMIMCNMYIIKFAKGRRDDG